MAEDARKALDRFRPEVIKKEWKNLLDGCNYGYDFIENWEKIYLKILNNFN